MSITIAGEASPDSVPCALAESSLVSREHAHMVIILIEFSVYPTCVKDFYWNTCDPSQCLYLLGLASSF